jgi:hypothetical protein
MFLHAWDKDFDASDTADDHNQREYDPLDQGAG